MTTARVRPSSGPDPLNGWRALAPCSGRELDWVIEDGTAVVRDVVTDRRVRAVVETALGGDHGFPVRRAGSSEVLDTLNT
jgi:hypothetical protein